MSRRTGVLMGPKCGKRENFKKRLKSRYPPPLEALEVSETAENEFSKC